MRALVFHEPGRMEIATLAVAPLAPGELRVRVRHAGICGTDLRIYLGTKHVAGPRVIGHEFAGTITEIAGGVIGYGPGDEVVVYPMITCGDCYACRAGRKNICVNRRTIGYEIDGGFAEYVTIPAAGVRAGNVIRIPPGVSDIAAAASEPVAAALQGVRRAGSVAGRSVLVMGGGPLGLAHVQLARLAKAEKIVMSEPQAERRAAAVTHGATQAVDPAELPDCYTDAGPDVVFVDVGVPNLVRQATELVRKGGRVVIFAGMPTTARVELDPNLIHYREVDVVGSSGSTPELQAEVLEQIAGGRLDVEAIVSNVLSLDDWRHGFDMKQSAAGMKVLLDLSR